MPSWLLMAMARSLCPNVSCARCLYRHERRRLTMRLASTYLYAGCLVCLENVYSGWETACPHSRVHKSFLEMRFLQFPPLISILPTGPAWHRLAAFLPRLHCSAYDSLSGQVQSLG